MKASSDRCAHVRTVRALVLIVALLALTAFARGQTILYVDDNAPDGGDGLSWDTAFNDLQDALTARSGPQGRSNEIRVAQGTYFPTGPSGAFELVNDTALLGGYAGLGAEFPDLRDVKLFETKLSGGLPGGKRALNVVTAVQVDASAILDGMTITGADYRGLYIQAASPSIHWCNFVANAGWYGGGVSAFEDCTPTFSHCNFIGNQTDSSGGAIYLDGASCTLEHCHFENNWAPRGGAIHVEQDGGSAFVVVKGCTFQGNGAELAGGAAFLCATQLCSVSDCKFRNNAAEFLGAALIVQKSDNARVACIVERCEFIDNDSQFAGGGLVTSAVDMLSINNVFVGNAAVHGAAYLTGDLGSTSLVNCTFAANSGPTIGMGGSAAISNCIVWGNSMSELEQYIPDDTIINNSNIQGGWSGPGSDNIDADPLFIQPGCDNLRLGVGSPCIDAGDNSAIPSGITTDLDGNSRIINAIVDMGAYEGEHEMLPQAACADDIDKGEAVNLTPEGGPFNPLLKPAATLINNSAENDAYATVTQIENQLHPGSGGFNEMGSKLQVETSLVPGAFFMRVFIDFDAEQLSGFDPISLDLTHFDSNSGTYELAAASNIQSSPGHRGPLGDRQVIIGTSWQGQISFDVGDYGVFWNPDLQRGFAWANVDHASDFAFGVPLPQCVGDCTFPSNGVVNLDDLTLVLDNWGTPPAGPDGFADITNNGLVDVDDLLAVIHAWGNCP